MIGSNLKFWARYGSALRLSVTLDVTMMTLLYNWWRQHGALFWMSRYTRCHNDDIFDEKEQTYLSPFTFMYRYIRVSWLKNFYAKWVSELISQLIGWIDFGVCSQQMFLGAVFINNTNFIDESWEHLKKQS